MRESGSANRRERRMSHRHGTGTAGRSGIRASTATGYRMPPLHPRPALGDCLAVYLHASAERPSGKIIAGACPPAATSPRHSYCAPTIRVADARGARRIFGWLRPGRSHRYRPAGGGASTSVRITYVRDGQFRSVPDWTMQYRTAVTRAYCAPKVCCVASSARWCRVPVAARPLLRMWPRFLGLVPGSGALLQGPSG